MMGAMPPHTPASTAHTSKGMSAPKENHARSAPRMVLDRELGFAAAGRDARAAIIEELYDHAIDVILRAEALGGGARGRETSFRHRVLGARAGEAAQGRTEAAVPGEVALVTGAAGHRQGMRTGVPAARRSGGGPGPQSGDRKRGSSPISSALRSTSSTPRRSMQPWIVSCAPSAAWTWWC